MMKNIQSGYVKIFVLLASLSVILSQDSNAQTNAPKEFDLKPHFNAVIVHNIDSAARWYKELFQLTELERVEFNGVRVVILESKDKSMGLELLQFPSMISPAEAVKDKPLDTRITGFFKVGFIVNNFDAWIKFLEDKKVKFIVKVQKDKNTGKRNFIIGDKDGNLLQFMEE